MSEEKKNVIDESVSETMERLEKERSERRADKSKTPNVEDYIGVAEMQTLGIMVGEIKEQGIKLGIFIPHAVKHTIQRVEEYAQHWEDHSFNWKKKLEEDADADLSRFPAGKPDERGEVLSDQRYFYGDEVRFEYGGEIIEGLVTEVTRIIRRRKDLRFHIVNFIWEDESRDIVLRDQDIIEKVDPEELKGDVRFEEREDLPENDPSI